MANGVNLNFHSQLRSVVDILAMTAVQEISKLVDDGFAILHLEISRSHKENEALKCKIQTMELHIARGCVEESGMRQQLAECRCGGVQSEGNPFKTTNDVYEERMDMPRMDTEPPSRHEDTPATTTDTKAECADMEERRTEGLLIKEERVEEDRDPQGEMNTRKERALDWRAGSREMCPVQETQNKLANLTEELTDQHRTRRADWEVSGLESALKTDPETESGKMLQHTGSEQSTGGLHSSCPEYLMCERTSQLRTFCTQGAGETEADDPSCSYATETSSESLSIHSGLQSLPPTGKAAASSLSLGSLDEKPEVVIIDSTPTEEEAEMHSTWNRETISEDIASQHRHYSEESEIMEVIPGNIDMSPQYAHISVRDSTEAPHILAPDLHARVPFDNEISAPKGIGTHRVERREKMYNCTYCGKAFNRPKKVEIHQRVHTGEKPHSCTLCGQQFSHSGSLNRHYRVHTGEKPFRCMDCGWCFSESGNLKKHQKVHSGGRPFRCTSCGRRFTSIQNLKMHQQRVHTVVFSVG